ncbi:HEAT repeat domain-containing protein [Acidocella aquatica]|nr:HEAT repeat domain-containing protein [Acidocella aquatica]
MPLVRRRGATAGDAREAASRPEEWRAQLGSEDARVRWRAAKGMTGEPGAGALLLARLGVEADSNVRAALFAGLVAIGGEDAAACVAALLRSRDPGLRGGAIEALQQLQAQAVPVVDALLGGMDADLRLLAVEVTRAWPVALAAPRLLRVIEDDAHVNVCAAAVDVAAEIGTPALLEPLARLRLRFGDEHYLAFAAQVARARIGGEAPCPP